MLGQWGAGPSGILCATAPHSRDVVALVVVGHVAVEARAEARIAGDEPGAGEGADPDSSG